MARAPTAARRIKVMISSQCRRPFPAGARTLTEIRQTIRDRLEGARLLGEQVFEVWINEDGREEGLDQNSWEACITQVEQADIVVVLSTGHAGWALNDGDIGICHAELMTARNASPSKVRLIRVEGTTPLADESADRNARFRDYLATVNSFSPSVATEAELLAAVDRAVVGAVSALVETGAREGRKGNFYSGDALTWSKLGYDKRSAAMTQTVLAALEANGGKPLSDQRIVVALGGVEMLCKISACPDALSVAASRERVGRPFLRDHLHIDGVAPSVAGPLHLIACGGGATATQARQLLGFPDATIVPGPFGVFVADEVQKVQFVLLRDCRDATTTRNSLHRFLDWLRENQELPTLAARAVSRRKIIDVVEREAGT